MNYWQCWCEDNRGLVKIHIDKPTKKSALRFFDEFYSRNYKLISISLLNK